MSASKAGAIVDLMILIKMIEWKLRHTRTHTSNRLFQSLTYRREESKIMKIGKLQGPSFGCRSNGRPGSPEVGNDRATELRLIIVLATTVFIWCLPKKLIEEPYLSFTLFTLPFHISLNQDHFTEIKPLMSKFSAPGDSGAFIFEIKGKLQDCCMGS